MRRAGGFTLIELTVTLAILAALAAIVLPVAQIARQRTQEQELRLALREIRNALDAYKRAGDEGRIQRQGTSSGYPARLEILVDGVADARNPKQAKIRFLRQLPRDPFFPDPAVDAATTWAKRSYASEADAPKEGEDIFDVFSRSQKIGLNGVPYAQW
jgi:general secretion pathway protein G